MNKSANSKTEIEVISRIISNLRAIYIYKKSQNTKIYYHGIDYVSQLLGKSSRTMTQIVDLNIATLHIKENIGTEHSNFFLIN
jgi:hypothetical protein